MVFSRAWLLIWTWRKSCWLEMCLRRTWWQQRRWSSYRARVASWGCCATGSRGVQPLPLGWARKRGSLSFLCSWLASFWWRSLLSILILLCLLLLKLHKLLAEHFGQLAADLGTIHLLDFTKGSALPQFFLSFGLSDRYSFFHGFTYVLSCLWRASLSSSWARRWASGRVWSSATWGIGWSWVPSSWPAYRVVGWVELHLICAHANCLA